MSEENTVTMIGVWIVDGHSEPIALFQFQEQAEEWARENYFGQWLTKQVTIPYTPLFTQEEWDASMEEGKKLAAKFKGLPEADD
jgi:hypothetical protein